MLLSSPPIPRYLSDSFQTAPQIRINGQRLNTHLSELAQFGKTSEGAEIVYDATVKFCDRFIDRHSRTHDQMVQAARSGRQNIAEGSQASGTLKND